MLIPERVVFALLWLACALYVGYYLRRDWIAHDEGTLAQSAERVARGELPHADFGEVYTGGLSYLNALSLAVGGSTLIAIRVALYVVSLFWVPALYSIARRFLPVRAAVLVSTLAVAWSVPIYSAAMPSWYNLFLATFGALALLKYRESGRRSWLILAGALGGASCLIKIVGLYFLAGGMLWLVFVDQSDRVHDERVGGRKAESLLAIASLVAFVACVLLLLRPTLGVREILYLFTPAASVALMLAWREWQLLRSGRPVAVAALTGRVMMFVGGAALPVLVFLVPFVARHAVGELFQGIFVAPRSRTARAVAVPPPLYALLLSIPHAVLLGLVKRYSGQVRLAAILYAMLGCGVILLLLLGQGWFAALLVWWSLAGLNTIVALAATVRLGDITSENGREYEILFLFVSLSAVVGLVQYPYSTATYFAYFAPILLLAVASLLSRERQASRVALLPFCMYLSIAVGLLHPYGVSLLRGRGTHVDLVPMGLERGGLRIDRTEAKRYERIIDLVHEHGRGEFIYAGPDAPEVYFLAHRRNPTRDIFDFLGSEDARDSTLVQVLREREVALVVVNTRPEFSRPLAAGTLDSLMLVYPNSSRIDHFDVRWK